MKKFLILSAITLMLFIACTKKETAGIQPSMTESQRVSDIAKPLVQMLKDSLLAELTAAINSGGPASAVSICNTKALNITSAIKGDSDHQVELKRVSNKYRNPVNAPDARDKSVLTQYEADISNGIKYPDSYIIKEVNETGTNYYYYTPLKIMPLCMNCHGDPQKMDPNLVQKLKELYPNDKATGYKEGDFRGLVRVKIIGKI